MMYCNKCGLELKLNASMFGAFGFACCVALLCTTAHSAGLKCSPGAMSPMEARLERSRGNEMPAANRISNAKKAAAKIATNTGGTAASSGSKVTYKTVKTGCCNSKTIYEVKGCCGAKVGAGSTKAEALSNAKSSKTTVRGNCR